MQICHPLKDTSFHLILRSKNTIFIENIEVTNEIHFILKMNFEICCLLLINNTHTFKQIIPNGGLLSIIFSLKICYCTRLVKLIWTYIQCTYVVQSCRCLLVIENPKWESGAISVSGISHLHFNALNWCHSWRSAGGRGPS